MVSGTRDNPSARDNFAERLYGVVSCSCSCSTLVSRETARQVTYWTKWRAPGNFMNDTIHECLTNHIHD